MKSFKLSIELVPSSSWHYNLRDILKPSMWEVIREKVYSKYSHSCSICQRKGNLHAHEEWAYDDKYHIQKLKNITCLCYLCHMVKHIGFAQLKGGKDLNDKLIKHFMEINKVDRFDFQNHLKEEMEKFNERSRYEWQLDLTKLKDFEK